MRLLHTKEPEINDMDIDFGAATSYSNMVPCLACQILLLTYSYSLQK